MDKIGKLKTVLKSMNSVLLAFSGGVDSTFLLKIAADTLNDNTLAVTAASPTYPKEELLFSRKIARSFGVKHKIIRTDEMANKKFSSNPVNRCYYCKKELFGRLKKIAKENRINFVIDASNVSDKDDFRPGEKSKKEFGIRSPLQEAGLTKDDIRKLSRRMKLITWDKPSLACLASRITYGTKISPLLLKKINRAETFIRKLGFNQVRLRHYPGNLCRIEVTKQDTPRLVKKSKRIVEELERLGYNYITVDLAGYRTGSLNEVIKK